MGMRREKTALNVDMSEEKISEAQKQLMRDVAARNRTIAMEQKLHEDRLQRRIQEMKQRRNMGVQEVMETMERQRSNLVGIQTVSGIDRFTVDGGQGDKQVEWWSMR